MITVSVTLNSAITGHDTELARMVIYNKGDSPNPRRGNYHAQTYRGRNKSQLDAAMSMRTITREGDIEDHARLQEHVWVLVGKALAACGYGQ